MQNQLTTPCIEHQGCSDRGGYGRRKYQGRSIQAHRVYYCLYNGCSLESIQGLVVRHRCDNRACVAGDHLELGTQQDNVRDMMERGRQGFKHALTEDEVREIRKSYVPGTRWNPSPTGLRQLARLYGVTHVTILKIVRNITYKDIT